jgi:hypothetical protein
LVNPASVDLLNPVNPGAFDIDSISLTYLVDGNPRNMAIYLHKIPGTDSFYLASDIAWYSDGGQTFFLKLNSTDTDTIFAKVDVVNGCGFEAKEVRYNGELVPLTSIRPGFWSVYEAEK